MSRKPNDVHGHLIFGTRAEFCWDNWFLDRLNCFLPCHSRLLKSRQMITNPSPAPEASDVTEFDDPLDRPDMTSARRPPPSHFPSRAFCRNGWPETIGGCVMMLWWKLEHNLPWQIIAFLNYLTCTPPNWAGIRCCRWFRLCRTHEREPLGSSVRRRPRGPKRRHLLESEYELLNEDIGRLFWSENQLNIDFFTICSKVLNSISFVRSPESLRIKILKLWLKLEWN